MLEIINGDKIRARMASIDKEIQAIKKLETEKQELQNVLDCMGEYWSVKRKYEYETKFFEKEQKKWITKHPFRSAQVAKVYNWLARFPFLAIYKGRANFTRFLAGSDSNEGLETRSQESNEQLLNRGESDRLEKLLKPFLKSKAEIAETSLSTV
jgi:hypothetical protein